MPTIPQSILVVDDAAPWRKTFRGLLHDVGYTVHLADSAASALEILETQPVDLAILDLRLDDEDEENEAGFDLARTIGERWSHIKIIMSTNYSNEERATRAREPDLDSGRPLANAFVPKKDSKTLVDKVRHVLAES
jgi:CheY-like chemotaxis protein